MNIGIHLEEQRNLHRTPCPEENSFKVRLPMQQGQMAVPISTSEVFEGLFSLLLTETDSTAMTGGGTRNEQHRVRLIETCDRA